MTEDEAAAVATFRLAIEVHEAIGRIDDLAVAQENLNASIERAAEQTRRLAIVVIDTEAHIEAEALAELEDDFYAR